MLFRCSSTQERLISGCCGRNNLIFSPNNVAVESFEVRVVLAHTAVAQIPTA